MSTLRAQLRAGKHAEGMLRAAKAGVHDAGMLRPGEHDECRWVCCGTLEESDDVDEEERRQRSSQWSACARVATVC